MANPGIGAPIGVVGAALAAGLIVIGLLGVRRYRRQTARGVVEPTIPPWPNTLEGRIEMLIDVYHLDRHSLPLATDLRRLAHDFGEKDVT